MGGSTCGTMQLGAGMTKKEDLLAKAKNNPKGLRFDEARRLAEYHSWVHNRTNGSHFIYTKEAIIGVLDFQETKDGKAKPYQVKQLLEYIEQEEEGDES